MPAQRGYLGQAQAGQVEQPEQGVVAPAGFERDQLRHLGLLQDALGQHVLDLGQVQRPGHVDGQQAGPMAEGC
jgi:hypothetical protein